MEDENGNLLTDPRDFEFLVDHATYKIGADGILVNTITNTFSAVNCTTGHLNNSAFTVPNKDIHKLFKCAPIDSYILGGSFSQDRVEYLSYYIKRCNKNTEFKYNITCNSNDHLKSYGYIYYTTLTQKNLVETKHYSNPIIQSINYKYLGFDYDPSLSRSLTIYYHISNLITDSGVIFEDNTNHTFLEFDYAENDVGKITYETIYSSTFYISNMITTYNREYVKIPAVFAVVG